MSVRYLLLSWPLRPDAPVYAGNPPAAATELTGSIERGDASNATVLHLFSHSGTHVDTPWHFNPDGPAGWQLPVDAYVFESPVTIALPKPDGGFITLDDLRAHRTAIARADLLLVRTGWAARRDADPEEYAAHGPVLHPDAARWLIDEHPLLRAIAVDAISIGSPAHPDTSVETHRVLTGVGRDDGRFVLIYEDVRMPAEASAARRVFAWPLFVEGADGSPCTIVAELAE